MRGRVAHAVGLGEALAENGVKITIVSGNKVDKYFQLCETLEVRSGVPGLWLFSLLRQLKAFSKSAEDTVILVRYASSNSWLVSLYLNQLRKTVPIKFGFEINSLAYHQAPNINRRIRNMVIAAEARALNKADFCYVVSDKIKEDITRSSKYPDASKIVVIPNGGPEAKQVNNANKNAKYKLNYVFFGIYQEYYDIELIIDAFTILSEHNKDVMLHFYGDGPKLNAIKSAIEKNSNIFEHGRYDLESLVAKNLNNENTVLLLPFSEDNENQIRSPIKLYEYMSLGLPIIATNCKQISNVLSNRHDGLLVDQARAKDWVSNMEEIYNNAALRSDISKNVAITYSSHTWKSRAENLSNFILNLKKMKNNSALIFIVGTGRSGTSLLQSMLASHSRIAYLPETLFFRRFVVNRGRDLHTTKSENLEQQEIVNYLKSDRYFQRTGLSALSLFESPELRDRITPLYLYKALLDKKKQTESCNIVGDKDPKSVEHLPVIHALDATALIIQMVRDPRDVLVSRKKAEWSRNSSLFKHLFAVRMQSKLAQNYTSNKKLDYYIKIKYEELITSPSTELKKICSQLNINFEESMLQFSNAAKKLVSNEEYSWKKETTKDLKGDNFGKWQEVLSIYEIAMTEKICSDVFANEHYQKSTATIDLSHMEKAKILLYSIAVRTLDPVYRFINFSVNARAIKAINVDNGH
jgi:glycosyltransferase involved in cell wall biosynthesis